MAGTRFRPLSLDIPKPLFPVAGLPIIQHHIEACVRVPDLKEIILLGYYPSADLIKFVQEMIQEYKIAIRYDVILFLTNDLYLSNFKFVRLFFNIL